MAIRRNATNTTKKSSEIVTNEERGLTPANSGTPMPKVKPAASPSTTKPETASDKKES